MNKEYCFELFQIDSTKFEFLSEFEVHGKCKTIISMYVKELEEDILIALFDKIWLLFLKINHDEEKLEAFGSINLEKI